MFGKLLRSIGVGGAKVDTIFQDTTCVPGGIIQGEVRIMGGNAQQDIESISISVCTQYEEEFDDHTYYQDVALLEERLCGRFTVQAGQEMSLPFSLQLPLNTPVTHGHCKVWVHTGLDIKGAIDPKDRDYLSVLPHPLVNEFFGAAERLGFRLREVDLEKSSHRNGQVFKQEFEFKPVGGEFAGRLDEIEAEFKLSENQVSVRLQVDRRARGLIGAIAESLDMDESYTGFTYGPQDIAHLDQILADAIRRYC